MAYNTIAYADIPREDMSAATSFYTTFQQMSLTLGIAISAAALAGSIAVHSSRRADAAGLLGRFPVRRAVAFMAPLLATRLDPDAGAELSGHRDRPAAVKAIR